MAKRLYIILVLTTIFGLSCSNESSSKEEKTVSDPTNKELRNILLVSKDYRNNQFHQWIKNLDSTIAIKECYSLSTDSLDWYLAHASGMIIGGGEDIHPSLYGKPEYVEVCGKFDLYRDTMELKMIHYAHENKIPILGVCRGSQILNVAHGGTLIPDIPSFIPQSKIAHRSKSDSAHFILPVSTSWLDNLIESKDTIWVNSRHHQCVDQLGDHFTISAYAPDSVVEAYYLSDTTIHPFTVGVQFHPENLRTELSNKIGLQLIEAMGK